MKRIVTSSNFGSESLAKLDDQEWVDLYDRLRLFIGEHYYGLVADEDLIAQAFVDVMEGKRTWDPDKLPFENLRLIIRSIASNQLQRQRKTVSFEEYRSSVGVNGNSTLTSPSTSQIDVLEQRQKLTELVNRLHQIAKGDGLLVQILTYLIPNPHWKPQEIARELGVSESEIYNARKRLLRRMMNQEHRNVSS